MPRHPVPALRRAGAFACLAFAGAALAQATLPAPALKRPPLKLEVPSGTWSRSESGAHGLQDNGRGSNAPQPGAVTGLGGFQLAFLNGDHKVRRIGVLAEDGNRFTRFAFADANGDDSFRAAATHVAFTAGSVGEVATNGGGKFAIPLPTPARAGHTLVLRGFEFRRRDGSDANLRNIGVWLDPAKNQAVVSLTDDQGLDFRGLEKTLGLAALAGGTLLPGVMEAATANAAQVAARNIPDMVGKHRGYQVTVQYAWIPSSLVHAPGVLAGAGGDLDRPRPNPPVHVLQGFEFTFDNSDHHLLCLGVNGLNAHATRGSGYCFQDNNRDDPVQWTVAYVSLKPEKEAR